VIFRVIVLATLGELQCPDLIKVLNAETQRPQRNAENHRHCRTLCVLRGSAIKNTIKQGHFSAISRFAFATIEYYYKQRYQARDNFTLKTPSLLALSVSIILLTVGLLLLHSSFLHPAMTYTMVFIVTSFFFCGMAWILNHVEVPRNFLFLAIGLAFLIRLSFLTATPVGSDDIYRYMWDGKVQSGGINPYLFAPDSSALDRQHSTLLPGSVNHPDMKSPYFPFSEWIFYICYQLSGEALWGYKLLLFLAELATISGLFLLLARLKLPAKFVLLYALCPLSIIQFGLDGHIDALGFPFLLFGLLLHLSGKRMPAYFLLALSISIKPVALVLLPILLLGERTWKGRLQAICIPIATVAIQYLPYLESCNPFDGLFVFARNWSFNGIVFESLYLWFANNQTSRLMCLILLSVTLLILYLSKKSFLDQAYVAVLLLLLLSPVVHPWYIAWLVVLLPLTRRWSGIAYAATASLTSLTILHYKLYGVWEQYPVILILEYLPVIVFLVSELRGSRPSPALA
jgi:hypothetical protein